MVQSEPIDPKPEQRVDLLLREGDLLQAYQEASTAMARDATNPRLAYLRTLALARLGETERAREAYDRSGLAASDDVDAMALGARLAKDLALGADDGQRGALLKIAGQAYRDVYAKSGSYFPAINAASMLELSGDRDAARVLAGEILAMPEIAGPADYYAAATAAEALVMLGRLDAAHTAAETALGFADANAGARSTTFRQLALLARARGDGHAVAELFRPAPVITYCGHMFRADTAAEAALSRQIGEALDQRGCSMAFGSLACGADILIAEAVLARGRKLHVFLPFQTDDFLRHSVLPGGEAWVARFQTCLARASSVTTTSDTPYLFDDNQYGYASQIMMGYAQLRAAFLNTSALQLALWDGDSPGAVAGTGADVGRWRQHGRETLVIEPGAVDRNLARPAPEPARPGESPPRRAVRAMIFTDFAGFSRLSETRLPAFWREVMGRVAAAVNHHREDLLSQNTWGDALFAVAASAGAAADMALDLQERLGATTQHEFGEEAGMRVSIHLGPVYEIVDPVTDRPTVIGREVNRTARIEPVTPVGQVYVSESFGAILAMEEPGRFELNYVGRVQLAKNHGELGMYHLRRRRG